MNWLQSRQGNDDDANKQKCKLHSARTFLCHSFLYTIKIPTVTLSSIALGTYLSHCWVLYIMKYKLHTDESSPGGGFNDGSNETKLQSK